MPGAGAIMTAMWPIVLLAAVSGLAFELVKWGVSSARRRIYNGNRNRKYAEMKHTKKPKVHKNMTWRTKLPKKPRNLIPPPPPPGFAEDLCRQWDKVHDSLEEMIKFGELMIELEDYVDNSFIFNDAGEIIRRHPGMRGFLAEECPHISYFTAMRYRILAMKAQEVARKQWDVSKMCKQCRTFRELGKRFDGNLKVRHRRLEEPRQQNFRKRWDGDTQPVIFSVREAVHSAGKLDGSRRRRVVNALLEIARELAVS